MKKVTREVSPPMETITERLDSAHPDNKDHPARFSHVFTIIPDVDTESLLCHASETLASLNVMTADLAGNLQGPHRSVALALQQLTELGELLVNRALENLDPPAALPAIGLQNQC
ncbi:DUF6124 family protein [Pseudomonas sp. G2-4]|uniref:DUF6124 family protein n=1 Tax=Pseudomonas sp. G2-4 TaxID=1506334 RepID=UPI0024BBB263|nr:DUF6124 family protein [Pseudomonas sp. G2-4]WHS60818.1 DUF6124 family protein [Pseudomonas sp. G2-4]